MIETHINPLKALSDQNQQIKPRELFKIINKIKLKKADAYEESAINQIKALRDQIDLTDKEIVQLLRSREYKVKKIAKIKKDNNVTIFQIERWNEILKNRRTEAKELNLEEKMLTDIFELIHKYSILLQTKIIK